MSAESSRRILVAASILSADFSRLAEEVGEVEKAGCDTIHVDVMDGHFVSNLTIGPPVIRWIRKTTRLPLDVHLMIEEPVRCIEDFKKAGSDWITVHIEAAREMDKTLEAVKKSGAKAGISLRPKTPVQKLNPYLPKVDLVLIMSVEPGFGGQAFMPEMMEKVRTLRREGFKGLISVDGGVNSETAFQAVEAGADILVAGTSIFGEKNRREAIQKLRRPMIGQ